MFERGEDGLVGGLHAGGAVEAADEPGVDAGRVEVMQARLGCNSIHFFGPESGRSYFWSCEIRLQRPPSSQSLCFVMTLGRSSEVLLGQ